MEHGGQVMADRGFQIKEELLPHFCSLKVPPGAQMKNQMTSAEITKSKDVANPGVHVECAINWMKSCRILKNVLTVSLLLHTDDIRKTSPAPCNLKPEPILFKERRRQSNVWLINKSFVNLFGLQ